MNSSHFFQKKIEFWAKMSPQKIALSSGEKQITYLELFHHCQKVKIFLSSQGLKPFEPVGVMLAAPLENCLIALGLLFSNQVGLVLEPRTPRGELERLLRATPLKGLIASPQSQLFKNNVQPPNRSFSSIVSLETLLAPSQFFSLNFDEDSSDYFEQERNHRELAWMLLTSGSTGQRKSVMMSAQNLQDRSEGEVQLLELDSSHIVVNALTTSHDLGLNQLLTSVVAGSELRILSSPFPGALLDEIDKEGAGMTGVPAIWLHLLEWLESAQYTNANPATRYITISGGSLDSKSLAKLSQYFPSTKIFRTYGQTETFRTFACSDTSRTDLGTPIAGVTAFLVDSSDDTVPLGGEGELIHVGHGTMSGYAYDPELSEKKFYCNSLKSSLLNTRGVRTGDLFKSDQYGNFTFLGRKDDMIKRFEHRIFLSEIEAVFSQAPGVLECCVLKVSSDPTSPKKSSLAYQSDSLVAFVCPKVNSSLSESDLISYGRENLTFYKIPDRFSILSAFPRTSVGKIDRQALVNSAALNLSKKEITISAKPSSWAQMKENFNLDPKKVYFDSMVLGHPPKSLQAVIRNFQIELDAGASEIFARKSYQLESEAIQEVADYFECSPHEIILTENSTQGLALVYSGLPLIEEDEILTSDQEHFSTDISLIRAAERHRCAIKRINFYADSFQASSSEIVGNIDRQIGPNTRWIAMTHVHSSTGVKLPIQEIAILIQKVNFKRPKSKQILICVDGTHALGIESLCLRELGVDFYISSFHKSLMGPRGTGFVFGKESAWNLLHPSTPSFSDPLEWEMWMKNIPVEAPMNALRAAPGGYHNFESRWALPDLFRFHRSLGKSKIQDRIQSVASLLKSQLMKIPQVELKTPISHHLSSGLVCFQVKGIDSKKLCRDLELRGVIGSVGPYRDAFVRFSVSVFNDESDVEAATQILKELCNDYANS